MTEDRTRQGNLEMPNHGTQRLANDDDDETIRWLKQPISGQPIICVVEQPM